MAMKIIGKAVGWLFSPPPSPISWAKVILWWEIRRIPYNIFAGLYGLLCLFIFLWAMTTSGPSDDGEDFFEPFALFVAPFVLNLCYTLGWLVAGGSCGPDTRAISVPSLRSELIESRHLVFGLYFQYTSRHFGWVSIGATCGWREVGASGPNPSIVRSAVATCH